MDERTLPIMLSYDSEENSFFLRIPSLGRIGHDSNQTLFYGNTLEECLDKFKGFLGEHYNSSVPYNTFSSKDDSFWNVVDEVIREAAHIEDVTVRRYDEVEDIYVKNKTDLKVTLHET